MPGLFPSELEQVGIKRRNETTNELLGTIFTRPASGFFVVGAVYIDHTEGGAHNEDIFEIDEQRLTLTHYKPGAWRDKHPEYGEFHKELKTFFL